MSQLPRTGSLTMLATAAVIIATSILAASSSSPGMVASPARGAALFATVFSPQQGLGPLYNNTSCLGCHNTPSAGGSGPGGLATVLRVGQLTNSRFDDMVGRGGPVARAHSIAELGVDCGLLAGVPMGANVTSVRNAPPLLGDGRIDAIPESAILSGAVPRIDDIRGRANLIGGRVGRFGWKADTPTLKEFVGEAFRNELGLTTPMAPTDLVQTSTAGDACFASTMRTPKLDAGVVDAVTTYVAALPSPRSRPGNSSNFVRIGCDACHTPSLGGVPLYSDLLLHDVGRALDDGVVQGLAAGHDWRTTPLWGLRQRVRYLHDGRAQSVEAAILSHGGEAEPAVVRFRNLSDPDRAALLVFLATL